MMMILIGDGVVMDVIEMMVDKQADLVVNFGPHLGTLVPIWGLWSPWGPK